MDVLILFYERDLIFINHCLAFINANYAVITFEVALYFINQVWTCENMLADILSSNKLNDNNDNIIINRKWFNSWKYPKTSKLVQILPVSTERQFLTYTMYFPPCFVKSWLSYHRTSQDMDMVSLSDSLLNNWKIVLKWNNLFCVGIPRAIRPLWMCSRDARDIYSKLGVKLQIWSSLGIPILKEMSNKYTLYTFQFHFFCMDGPTQKGDKNSYKLRLGKKISAVEQSTWMYMLAGCRRIRSQTVSLPLSSDCSGFLGCTLVIKIGSLFCFICK